MGSRFLPFAYSPFYDKITVVEMKEKNKTSGNTIDLFVVNDATRKRSRQSTIMQTWAMLSAIDYNSYDYDAWLMDFSIEDIELEKEVIAGAVENIMAVQEHFEQASEERRRLRLVK